MIPNDRKDCDWPAVIDEPNFQPSKTSFSDELNPKFFKNWKNYPTPKAAYINKMATVICPNKSNLTSPSDSE